MFILNDWILMLHFSFLLFVVMKNKRWLCAVSRASLSVPTVVVIKRRISFDASTKYNILLKEDRIDPRLRKMTLKIDERRALTCTIPPVASSPYSNCSSPGHPSVVQS